MYPCAKVLPIVFFSVTLSWACNSSALTMGAVQGAVQIGHGLKLSVPVQMSEQEAREDLCFDADVLYGDNRLGSAQISVKWDEFSIGKATNVYIGTSVSVDEPVVTVNLRAGCLNRNTRTYVLLAELVLDRPLAAPQPLPTTLPSAALLQTKTAAEQQPQLQSTPQAKLGKSRQQDLTVDKTPQRRLVVPKTALEPRSRLQVSAVDLASDTELGLKVTEVLSLDGIDDPKRRSQAAAMWRSLNMTAQDVVNADSRASTLEADVKNLQEAARQQQEQMQSLKARLDESQAHDYTAPLIFGILLLGFAAAGVFLSRKFRRNGSRDYDPAWWQAEGSELPADSSLSPPTTLAQPERSAHLSTSPTVVLPPRESAIGANAVANHTQQDLDIRLDDLLTEVPPTAVHPSQVVPSKTKSGNGADTMQRVERENDFEHSAATSMRLLNTQDMGDIRQKAEFFMALGRHEEAIHLLQDSLTESEANPLIYLDLLKILHSLHQLTEFERFRVEFNALFSGYVPPYSGFLQEGRGIDLYEEVCQGIVARWRTDRAIDYLEQCLVHTSDAGATQSFDLAAFRDLLTLHSIARRLEGDTDSKLAPFSAAKDLPLAFGATNIPPKVDIDLTDQTSNLIDFEFVDSTPKQ